MPKEKRIVSPELIEQIYQRNRENGSGPTNDHQLALAINRDPASLWQSLYNKERQSNQLSTLTDIADALSVTVEDISILVSAQKAIDNRPNDPHIRLTDDAKDLFRPDIYQMFKGLEQPTADTILHGINQYLSYHRNEFRSIQTRPSYHLFWAMHPLMSSDGIALEPDLMSREVTIDDMIQTIRDNITDPVMPEPEPPEPIPDTVIGMVRQLLRLAIRRLTPPSPQPDPLHIDDLRQIIHDLNASRARRDSDGVLAAVRAIYYWVSSHHPLIRRYLCTYQILNSITTIIQIADPSALYLQQIADMLLIEINDHVFHTVPWFGRGSCKPATDAGGNDAP